MSYFVKLKYAAAMSGPRTKTTNPMMDGATKT